MAMLLYVSNAFAQEYVALFIPDSLKKNANAIVREDVTKTVIHSNKSATVYSKSIVTVLNEKGERYASCVQYYDKFRKIERLNATLYDAFGNKIRSAKKKDFSDESYYYSSNFMDDIRLKSYNFYYRQYPYTIEFEYEIETKGIYSVHPWQPFSEENVAVQKSTCIVEVPKDYNLRFKLLNGMFSPTIVESNDKKIFQWEAKNILPFKEEIWQPSLDDIKPSVLFGLSEFEYGGYAGNMSTWEEFGKYFNQLYQGRDVLPAETKAEIIKLTAGLTNTKDKIAALYEYLQKNFHYISIQLGIGGFQPFDATFVAQKKYGDCKALSNPMVSMLKEVGIPSYSALIHGGREKRPFYDDFPADYFNHVIACVPNNNDTIWLECTSSNASPGYLGSFTGNRYALLLTEVGGKIVKTPTYTAKENTQLRVVKATVNESGDLNAEVNTNYTGVLQELPNSLFYEVNADERKKFLNSRLNLPTYTVNKIEYSPKKDKVPEIREYLNLTASHYANITSKRLFIVPNLFNRTSALMEDTARKFDIVFNDSYSETDSISITIPPGYKVEAMPQPFVLNNKYGRYQIQYTFSNNTIQLYRSREQSAGIFPSGEYGKIVEFFTAIKNADNAKLVFIKESQ